LVLTNVSVKESSLKSLVTQRLLYLLGIYTFFGKHRVSLIPYLSCAVPTMFLVIEHES
jgi:hypothetical protein